MHWRPYFYHLPLARLKHSSVALVLNQTGFSQLKLWVPWWPLLEKMDLFYHKFQSCAISTIFLICATHLTFEQKRVTSSHSGSNNRAGPVWWMLNYFDNYFWLHASKEYSRCQIIPQQVIGLFSHSQTANYDWTKDNAAPTWPWAAAWRCVHLKISILDIFLLDCNKPDLSRW